MAWVSQHPSQCLAQNRCLINVSLNQLVGARYWMEVSASDATFLGTPEGSELRVSGGWSRKAASDSCMTEKMTSNSEVALFTYGGPCKLKHAHASYVDPVWLTHLFLELVFVMPRIR